MVWRFKRLEGVEWQRSVLWCWEAVAFAGIAWETGVLTGLADEGVNVITADFVVGTSAGGTVAAQLGSGLPLNQLFERQADPALQIPELVPTGMSVTELTDTMVNLAAEIEDPAELRRRVGALALTASTVPESARLAVIEARLPVLPGPSARSAW